MQTEQSSSSESKAITAAQNPFYSGRYGEHDCFAQTVADRLEMVSRFDLQQCQRALQLQPLQTTVKKAIERRIRHLHRESQARNERPT